MRRFHADQQAKQRAYYARTASAYDDMHFQKWDEHQFALAAMQGFVELFEFKSILDIGSGTGRALLHLKDRLPDVRIVGIEPSKELREIGYRKGLSEKELRDGDAHSLEFADEEFDLVCEFATLHHVPRPDVAVQEMLRVSRSAIFISDSNRYGQGSAIARAMKFVISELGLWSAFDFIKTGGKMSHYSEDDGVFYSYSLFDQVQLIRKSCESIHMLNTIDSGHNLKRTAGQAALLGLKTNLLGHS